MALIEHQDANGKSESLAILNPSSTAATYVADINLHP
jgi:hypothetical protein